MSSTPEPAPDFRIVPAVDRAARLLAMIEAEQRPMGISELARRLGASKGSVREVLETLHLHGLLERDEQTKRYMLGPSLARLGNVSRQWLDVARLAQPVLARLANEVEETALLVVPQEDRLRIEQACEPADAMSPVAVSATAGRSFPLMAGACGKVFSAFCEPEVRAARLANLPRYTPASIVDPAEYDRELERVRRAGYALDDEEFMEGIRGAAAPVFDDSGRLVAAVLVSALAPSLHPPRLEVVASAVAAAARAISAALGAPTSASPPAATPVAPANPRPSSRRSDVSRPK
ncbi:MAG: IclR family transcriptional regulator [Solirubrobacterales bacterium]|nr:IclR family transcriptional regulator [Solirubrobacterales bacterium]